MSSLTVGCPFCSPHVDKGPKPPIHGLGSRSCSSPSSRFQSSASLQNYSNKPAISFCGNRGDPLLFPPPRTSGWSVHSQMQLPLTLHGVVPSSLELCVYVTNEQLSLSSDKLWVLCIQPFPQPMAESFPHQRGEEVIRTATYWTCDSGLRPSHLTCISKLLSCETGLRIWSSQVTVSTASSCCYLKRRLAVQC